MDLSEVREGDFARHPWEVARAEAIVEILRRQRTRLASVLDYGCGDGFTGGLVQSSFHAASLVGLDVHLAAHSCDTRPTATGTVEFIRSEAELGERRFDLVLLCDVIEHIEDDVGHLSRIASRWLAPDGLVLVTVPAFQQLFSEHDRALRHYRRYDARALHETLSSAALLPLASGYLFGSLLPIRALGKLRERLFGPPAIAQHGVGQWTGGEQLTATVTRALALDNRLLLWAGELGVQLPGLTAWALCETP